MGAPYIWGSLDRAVNDSTKIEQAITTAVSAHNDNPDAHLEAGQALESHRAALIIDHRAESVVNDKIKANARTYIAIVDPDGDGDFDNVDDAVDYAYEKGGGSVYIKAGSYWVARPLKMRYGVDLYGEGPRETHLTLAGDMKTALNLSGLSLIETSANAEFYYYDDQYLIEYFIDGFQGDGQLEYTLLRMPYGDIQCYEETHPGALVTGDMAPESSSTTDVEIVPTVNSSVSSKIVHVNGWQVSEGLETAIGQKLYTDAGELGTVYRYLGNGDYELFYNSLLDTYLSPRVWSEGDTGRMSVISGISLNQQNAETLITVDGRKGRLYIRDSTFTNVHTLFYSDPMYQLSNGEGVTMEDCIITPTTSAILTAHKATFRNCDFVMTGAVASQMIGGYSGYYENCRFIGNLAGTSNILRFVYPGSRFQSCTFARAVSAVMVDNGWASSSDPNAMVMFSDCEFVTTPLITSALFKGREIMITGCRFFCANTVGLDSTTRNSVFTANQGRGATAAQPINCLVTANGFWTS